MALAKRGNGLVPQRWEKLQRCRPGLLLAQLSAQWRVGVAIGTGLVFGACQRAETPVPLAPIPPANLSEVQPKAQQGNPEAQKTLGDLYAAGRGLPQDFKEAVAWYRKAADQGNAAAQNSLGELTEAGQGLAPSDVEAAAWFRKAAEQGNEAAQFNLAVLYAFGRGVRLDEAEAVKWYRKAAELGNALAQFNIGQRYQLGKGVPADLVEAYMWLSLAAESIPDSAKLRDELKSSMTRAQVAEARRRLATFVPAKKVAAK